MGTDHDMSRPLDGAQPEGAQPEGAQPESAQSEGPRPLDGITVIDLSRVLAGPLCGQMLADHGAEVIKVEPPNGDDTRTWGPPFLPDGSGAYFSGLNRSKHNVSLDLRTDAGIEVHETLLADADVLVENFKAGTLAKWGLTDEVIAERYPRLVHCRITGFGTDGPMGGAPGYDAVLQAYGALMSVNGEAAGPPTRVGVPIVDMMTGYLSFSGILLALRERDRSGRGQLVDATLLDSAIAMLHPHSANLLNGGTEPARMGSAHSNVAPYDVYDVADGQFFLAVGNDRQFRSFAGLIGLPELADDPRFLTNADRVQNYPELKEILADKLKAFDRETLGKDLLSLGVPGGPVHLVSQALDDPQVRHRGMVIEDGDYRGIGNPVKLGRTPAGFRWAPRAKGADTRAVLERHGFDEERIERLTATGAAIIADTADD